MYPNQLYSESAAQPIQGISQSIESDAPAPEIPRQLERVAKLVDHLNAKLAQVEDRLGPIRSPFATVNSVGEDGPMPSRSVVADQLVACAAGLERACQRIDVLLGDIEI